jgi:hypothetical protein
LAAVVTEDLNRWTRNSVLAAIGQQAGRLHRYRDRVSRGPAVGVS